MRPAGRGSARVVGPGTRTSPDAGSDTDNGQRTRHQRRRYAYGTGALDGELERLERTVEGHRHHDLAASARRLGQLVAGGVLHRDRVAEALVGAGRALGLPESDCRRAVAWGLRRGADRPRSLPDRAERDGYDRALAWWALWDGVDQADFPGSRGSTQLRVLAAFVLAGVTARRDELSLSYRQVADRSGLALSTVTPLLARGGPLSRYVRAAHRPRPHRWQPDDGPRSTTWRPVPQRASSVQPGHVPAPCPPGCTGNARIVDPARNAWLRRSNHWRVAGLLDSEREVTVSDLVAETGLHPATVRRILRDLAASGHAERVDRTTWRGGLPPAVSGPDVAADGVDHLALRRERHREQREAFAVYVAERHRWDLDDQRRCCASGGDPPWRRAA